MPATIPGLPEPDFTIHRTGANETKLVGELQRSLLQHCGLTPTTRLLEIGCGVGRLAYELAPILSPHGSYAGFDISPAAIDWLVNNYTSVLPNFRFDLVEVTNLRYRPDGGTAAVDATFPYSDRSFDMACSFSVFTHMRLPEIRRYLDELRRVLVPGGLGVMTFFLITPDDVEPSVLGRPFVKVGRGWWSTSPKIPEKAIAFDSAVIDGAVADAGLTIVDRIIGGWRPPPGPPPAFDFPKDVLVLTPA